MRCLVAGAGLMLLLMGTAFGQCKVDGVEWLVGGQSAHVCGPGSLTGPEGRQGPARDPATRAQVAPALQLSRDTDRMAILTQELQGELREQSRIEGSPSPDAATLARHRANSQAIRNEIERLRPRLR